MSTEKVNKMVVCFGEILWDNLPSGKKAGGAPMNVAYHLHHLGIDSLIISRVGDDESGKELFKLLEDRGLSTAFCQVDTEYATSEVLARISPNHEVSYDIVYPVAWDFIEWKNEFGTLLKKANAFVFGSLINRHKVSRAVLHRILEVAKYRVLDINLRTPHYSPEVISDLLHKTDLLKLNVNELYLVGKWFAETNSKEIEIIAMLQDKFNIKEILVTRGDIGASYFIENTRYDHGGYSVQVADTVGSGDAFLAAFLSKKLSGAPVEEALDYACILGAFVTTHAGACPNYGDSDLNQFISGKTKNKVEINSFSK